MSLVLFVSDWEIECCAPPPAVGAPATWGLELHPADGDDLARPYRVVPRPPHAVAVGVACAYWPVERVPLPPAPATVRGTLFGTAHGGRGCRDEGGDLPRARGVVRRVRVVTRELAAEAGDPRNLVPVPGSLRLTDVTVSPRWFAAPDPVGPGDWEIGVLLDLDAVRAVSPDE